jgi:aryl-alcohol dehydrogenase-like predicted oxidoreductase
MTSAPAPIPPALPVRHLGDLTVSAIGLGCMPMSDSSMVDQRDRAMATLHTALDAGITLLDTANIYAPAWNAMGHNEGVVAEGLRTYTGPADLSRVVVATKGGITRGPGETWGRAGDATSLLAAAEASRAQLGVDVIDLYQHHRHDPAVSYADQVRALAAVKAAGLVRRIGLSNCTAAELQVALDEVGGPRDGGIVSVQNEWSPRYRDDADVLQMCTDEGICFLPWSPLGGSGQARTVGSAYAAWLLATTPVMVPIPGASRPETVASIVRSLDVTLSAQQMARLNATVPAHGSMYPEDVPRSPLR